MGHCLGHAVGAQQHIKDAPALGRDLGRRGPALVGLGHVGFLEAIEGRQGVPLREAGVAEGASNIGHAIKALYQKIYRAGDDEIEYFYNDSPVFAQYWDEYEGDLNSIIAEVDPAELQIILDELESYADQAGLAEEKVRLDPKCWKGKHKEGTKIKGGVRVNNCVPNESVEEAANAAQQAAIAINMKKHHKKPKDKLKESFDDIRNEFNKIKEEFEQENPVVNAITRRVMHQRHDLLAKYGPEAVTNAIDSVADFVGDVDEIGSSDVSAWVKHVERELGHGVEEQATIVKQRSIPVRSSQVIEQKMQSVREAFQAYKQGKK